MGLGKTNFRLNLFLLYINKSKLLLILRCFLQIFAWFGGENDDERLLKMFWRLVESCFYQMRKRQWFPLKSGFLVRYGDQVSATRSLRISPPASGHAPGDGLHLWNHSLFEPLQKLFFDGCQRRVRVCFFKVWFQEFHPLDCQLSLFHLPSSQEKKARRLVHAMDHIQDRYGADALHCGRAA